jgi:long-chain acyl-CoA synthetase
MHIQEFLTRNSKLYAQKPALICNQQSLTYNELIERTFRLGNSLISLGLTRGDRVAFLDYNSIYYAEFHLGAPMAGLIAVPLNFRLVGRELKFIINDASCTALFYSSPFTPIVEEIRKELPSVKYFISLSGTRAGDIEYEELLSSARPESLPPCYEDDSTHILYTSGTTGFPKGAVLSYRNMLTAIRGMIVEEQIVPENKVLHVVPFFHVAGAQPLLAFLYRGCTGTILPQFDSELVMEIIQRERISNILLVPSMINTILNHPKLPHYDLSSLSTITYAAAAMPKELLRKGLQKFGQVFFQIYGITEASMVTALRRCEHEILNEDGEYRYLGSCGREIIDVQVRVIDDNGNDIMPGKIGEIIVKGDNVMQGYWQQPEETTKFIKDSWFYTGDLGTLDEDGYLFLLDRKKDMIISGGENIYPAEIENVLYLMPEILEAAVIGVPDEKWGETVKAAVVFKEGKSLSQREIIEFCKKNLASYKKPTSVEFVQELPKNPAGKVLKKILRERYFKKGTNLQNPIN